MTTTEPTTEIIDQGAPNTVAMKTDMVNELAATGLAIFDKEEERREFQTRINGEIKKLKKRYREIAHEVKAGGTQLIMNFGTVKADTEPEKKSRRNGRSRVH
jgi:predicted nuclease with TOPRIM domain